MSDIALWRTVDGVDQHRRGLRNGVVTSFLRFSQPVPVRGRLFFFFLLLLLGRQRVRGQDFRRHRHLVLFFRRWRIRGPHFLRRSSSSSARTYDCSAIFADGSDFGSRNSFWLSTGPSLFDLPWKQPENFLQRSIFQYLIVTRRKILNVSRSLERSNSYGRCRLKCVNNVSSAYCISFVFV